MKSKHPTLMAALLGPVIMFTHMASPALAKEDLTKVYEAGRTAFNKGDLATAKVAFAKVLRAKPEFDLAKIYMAQIRHAEAQWEARPRSQKIAEQAFIKSVDLQTVPLADALEVVRREMEAAGRGTQTGPIEILTDIPAEALERPITLTVKNQPMTHFLDLIGFAGDVRIAWHSRGLSVTAGTASPDKSPPAADAAIKAMHDAATSQVIPLIQFDNTTVDEALRWLQTKADPNQGPLIVLRGPVPPTKLTFTLRHSSIPDALRSIAIVADLQVTWHAWGAGLAPKSTLAVATTVTPSP